MQLQLPLVSTTIRYTICTRCGDEVYLADGTTPDEDFALWKRHVCTHKWVLKLVRTRA